MIVLQVIQICITSLLGIFGVAAALNGFLFRQMNPLFRVLMALGGLGMMYPGAVSDVIGLVVVGGIYAYQFFAAKKEKLSLIHIFSERSFFSRALNTKIPPRNCG